MVLIHVFVFQNKLSKSASISFNSLTVFESYDLFYFLKIQFPEKAVAFKRRAPVPAISRWTTCVKAARVVMILAIS